jgi:hypothetical protein
MNLLLVEGSFDHDHHQPWQHLLGSDNPLATMLKESYQLFGETKHGLDLRYLNHQTCQLLH